uniref:melanoma inhibitory activity protein 2-like isoform X3 n=1 Tax=Myxine glutinosa TaxID=7769 RepID=UPI00358F2F59
MLLCFCVLCWACARLATSFTETSDAPQELLSDFKLCAEPSCSTIMCQTKALQQFTAQNCLYMTLKVGSLVHVYHKLVGRNDALWAGSVGKRFGYFPKKFIDTRKCLTKMEIELPTEEKDFICVLNGEDINKKRVEPSRTATSVDEPKDLHEREESTKTIGLEDRVRKAGIIEGLLTSPRSLLGGFGWLYQDKSSNAEEHVVEVVQQQGYQKSQDTVEANYLSTVQFTMMEIGKVLVSTFYLMVQSVQPFTKQVIPWLEEYLPFSIEDSGSLLKALLFGSLVLIFYFWKICVLFKMKCTLRKEKQLASTIVRAIKRKTTLAEEIEVCKRILLEKHDVIEHSLKVQEKVKFSHHQQKEILDDLGLTMKRLQCELDNKVEERKEMRDRCNEQREKMMQIGTDMEEIDKESTGLQTELAKIEQKVSSASGDCKTLQASLIDIIEKNGRYKAEVEQLGDRVVALTNHSEKLENQLRVEHEMSHCLNSSLSCMEDKRQVLDEYLSDLKAASTADNTSGPTTYTMLKAHKEENEQWRLKHVTDERWIKAAIEVMEEQKLKSQEILLQENESKKNLEGRLDCLRKENEILMREKQHLEAEQQQAQHRLEILAEMYKEKDSALERKVVVEELAQKQTDESLVQYHEELKAAQEKISKYKKRQQDLTEELLDTEKSFKHQISECEKKIHKTWLTERKTIRHLQNTREEVDNLKQWLIRLHLKFEAQHSILRPVPERPRYGRSRHPIGGSLCTSPYDLPTFDDDQGSNPGKFRPHSAGPLHVSPYTEQHDVIARTRKRLADDAR